MCKLRAACALAQGPDAGRRRFESLVDLNVSAAVQDHTCFFQPDVLRVGDSADGDKDIGSFQKRRSRRGIKSHPHGTSGRAFDPRDLRVRTNIDAIEAENLQKSLSDIFIPSGKQLCSSLQNADTASETYERLCELQANIPAAQDNQMFRKAVEFERLYVRERFRRAKAGDVRNGRVSTEIQEHPVAL
jgi:hypothetical protein